MPDDFSHILSWNDAAGITVAQVISLYLQHLKKRCKSGHFSEDGFENINRDLRQFAAVFGNKTMAECRKYDLTEWLDSNPQWRSNHTKKRVMASVVRPFTWAEDQEIISRSPYRKVKDMKFPTRPRRPATIAEYVLLMRSGSRALRRALFFLRRSGARTCEMRELLWIEVDFDRGIIRKEVHKTINVTGVPRFIGIEPVLLRFLKNLYRNRDSSQEHVFTNCRGQPWTRHSLATNLRRLANSLGIDGDLSAYCFRHLWACTAVQRGMADKGIADQMGHTNTRLVAWYGQTSGNAEHLRRVATEAMKRNRKNQG